MRGELDRRLERGTIPIDRLRMIYRYHETRNNAERARLADVLTVGEMAFEDWANRLRCLGWSIDLDTPDNPGLIEAS